MPLLYEDKLVILCVKGEIYEKNSFVRSYNEEEIKSGKAATDQAMVLSRRSRWFKGENRPQGAYLGILTNMLTSSSVHKLLSKADMSVTFVLGEDSNITLFRLLDVCDLRFLDIDRLVTKETELKGARADWEGRMIGLPSLSSLSVLANERARKVLAAMRGVYYLYRKHSVLPGILREVIVVDTDGEYYSEGRYFQIDLWGNANRILFNMFYGESYLLVLGSHTRNKKDSGGRESGKVSSEKGQNADKNTHVEIITINILIDNVFDKNGNENPRETFRIGSQETQFVGLLSGIYDYENTLLAERVFLRKIHGDPTNKSTVLVPRRLLLEDNAAEYRSVHDIIDNTLDGQTLAVRLSRLEWSNFR